MNVETFLCISFVAMVTSFAGSCSFIRWQDGQTERACISAGRAMRDNHCSAKDEPKGTRIQ